MHSDVMTAEEGIPSFHGLPPPIVGHWVPSHLSRNLGEELHLGIELTHNFGDLSDQKFLLCDSHASPIPKISLHPASFPPS